MAVTWVVFWVLLIPLLIILFITYVKTKEWYRLIYLISVFTYVLFIIYWIDAYELSKNMIFGLLATSAAVMMWLGWFFRDLKTRWGIASIWGAIVCIISIVMIAVLSLSNIGLIVNEETVKSLGKNKILFNDTTKQPSGIVIRTITIDNDFLLPRAFALKPISACYANTNDNTQEYADVRYSVSGTEGLSREYMTSVELSIKEKKTVQLLIMPRQYFNPYPTPKEETRAIPVPVQEIDYTPKIDTVYLFDGQTDCYMLTDEQKAKATSIPIE